MSTHRRNLLMASFTLAIAATGPAFAQTKPCAVLSIQKQSPLADPQARTSAQNYAPSVDYDHGAGAKSPNGSGRAEAAAADPSQAELHTAEIGCK